MASTARDLARTLALATATAAACMTAASAQGWTPTGTVQFIVPASTGGGADQMARKIQDIIEKKGLIKQSLVIIINKSGKDGAEGFLDVKGSTGDPNKLFITLSNVLTTPLATSIPSNYMDITPVAKLVMDQFILWVNAKSPYQTAGDYMDALKGSSDGQMKMGGTGSKQEDQIITAAIERATGAKLTYVPSSGGSMQHGLRSRWHSLAVSHEPQDRLSPNTTVPSEESTLSLVRSG